MKNKMLFLALFHVTSQAFAAARPDSANELLSEAYTLSSQILRLGMKARGELSDPELRNLNERMMEDHDISRDALLDTAALYDLEIEKTALPRYSLAKNKDFPRNYLREVIKLNEKQLELIESSQLQKDSPGQKVLNQYRPRLKEIIQNAQTHLK